MSFLTQEAISMFETQTVRIWLVSSLQLQMKLSFYADESNAVLFNKLKVDVD